MRVTTSQEFFNAAFSGARADGFRLSFSKLEVTADGREVGVGCAYRGARGAKCIVGHGVSDEELEQIRVIMNADESFNGDCFVRYGVISFEDIPDGEDACSFMRALQMCHDVCSGSDYERLLRQFAGRYGLTVPA